MRGVIEDEFSAGEEGGSEDRIVDLHKPRTLLGNGLERIAVGKTGRDRLGRGLEERARALRNRGGFALDGKEECGAASHEWSGHRRLDELHELFFYRRITLENWNVWAL